MDLTILLYVKDKIMNFNRYAYFFLNIFEKLDEKDPDWDHLSKLTGFMGEFLLKWHDECLFDDRIIKIAFSIYNEFSRSIDNKERVTTITINDIKNLNTLIEEFIQKRQ